MAWGLDRFPDYECLIVLDRNWHEERVSLARFFARAKAFQAALGALGIVPGDHVVLILPTGSDLVSAYFGAMFAGAVEERSGTITRTGL